MSARGILFQQRLIHQGTRLEDAEKIDSGLDLVLILEDFCDGSEARAHQLAAAAKNGSVDKVGV